MYLTVLLLHSWLRWLALIAGVGATFVAFRVGSGAQQPKGWPGAERWGLIFMITLDVQMLLGLVLYGMLSPYTAAAMTDFGAAMRDPVLRFWAVEHFTMMLAAVVLVHVGRVLARKTDDVAKKRTRFLVCFGLAVLLMLLGMPWPGTASGRPLFRV
jgi:heme A synthase